MYSFSLAQSSVLASGEWYKIGITQPGIYKLDRAFLQKAGIVPSSIQPQHIKIYGNGGGMLPQANNVFRHQDLVENAIYVEGEKDNRFDETDFVLFYAQGPHAIHYQAAAKRFVHQTNVYSDTAYYFLTMGTTPGLRIADKPGGEGAAATITTFDDYVFHEKEQINQLATISPQYTGSGREWYGEKFVNLANSHTIDLTLPGIVQGSPLQFTSAVMARASGATQFTVKLNQQTIGTHTINGVSSDRYDLKGINQVNTFTSPASVGGNNLQIAYTYDPKGSSSAEGYLNYLGIQVLRELKLYGNQTAFRSLESIAHPAVQYLMKEVPAGVKVWDITDPLRPANQSVREENGQVTFTASATTLREFIAFSGSAFDSPVAVSKIPNQDLHSLSPPQLLIITPGVFLAEAQTLAQFRQQHDQLSVAVVNVAQIYNEFSSGRQDITAIRDFIRYLYGKNQALQYVLLFGDASYDYKNRISTNTNFVPIYESRESLHPIFSYSSDDYYGFMDENEGEWQESMQGDQEMDIAVGRLPVKSVAEAEGVVHKLIRYATDVKTFGKWRNKICFVADDGDNNTHQLDADRLTTQISSRYPQYTINKIYIDAFPQVSNPNGQTAPVINSKINEAVEKGHLIINYTGHGGEAGWAEEQIVGISQINEWKNTPMPLLVTATCEFGRYDDPLRISGAEYALLNPKGGGIGLITTTRPVFSNTNYALNTAFYSAVFEQKEGQWQRLGDIMKYTKNNSLSGSVNRNFALLGDPSMRLAYPQKDVVITKINGKDISSLAADTLKALSKVTLEGYIGEMASGQMQTGFNGELNITVYDKATTLTTLGTERSAKMNFQVQQNLIYEGKARVKNGTFEVSFVVPKDIDYRFGSGKISLYARDEQSLLDAAGARLIIIGGSGSEAATDTTPPQIRLFMNDTTFVSGGITGAATSLLAYFYDESGINITGNGIGHQITATLRNGKDSTILLNEYYIAGPGTYQQGEIVYPFQNLRPGAYTLLLKAWDTHNNSAETSIEFVVAGSEEMVLQKVLNFPNPFSTATTFEFDHNRAGEPLAITIDIFTGTGKLVKTWHTYMEESPEHISGLTWDGTQADGNKLSSGVYIYRISVRSMADQAYSYQVNKLIIIQ